MVGEHITDATTTDSNYSSRVAEPVYATGPPATLSAPWTKPATRSPLPPN